MYMCVYTHPHPHTHTHTHTHMCLFSCLDTVPTLFFFVGTEVNVLAYVCASVFVRVPTHIYIYINYTDAYT